MPISPGTKLGPYEVTGPLGAGGMGEVYRARDTKLGRDVAIKALPAEVAEEPERLARFRREAQLLASLNHPHIASIYGLEEVEGVPFLILELVEGEDLSGVLRRGPLATNEAMDIARQVAEALEEAHENGVIHRDLKPGNIKMTSDGKVKVLDFGLAKAFAGDPTEGSSTGLSQSPTMTRATAAGVILGTAAYMSPEQARGKTVDKRADIFSFGCVLYEMLTGRQAFTGEMVSDILASILKTEPDWDRLPANLPPRLEQLVRRCLEKDPKKRCRDIGDVRNEIDHVLVHPGEVGEEDVPEVKIRKNLLGIAALVALLAGGTAGIAVWNLKPSPSKPLTRFGMVLPEGDQFTAIGRHFVALSPDGTRIAFIANDQIYLRAMDQMETIPIRGTEGDPRSPFFSPDGQWLGFWSDGMLKKVPATGGAPVSLCEAGNPFGASWATDNTIVFGQGSEGIFRVSANGGSPEELVSLDADSQRRAQGPQILPGGTSLLFSLNPHGGPNWDQAQVVVQSLETGERRVLVDGGSDARYVSTGHLVYALGESLMAASFDLTRHEVTGRPVPVVEGVMRSVAGTGAAHFSLSDSGSLVYVSGSVRGDSRLVRVDRQGEVTSLTDRLGDYYMPALSPDGKRLAVYVYGKDGNDIWIQDLDRGTLTRLTTEGNCVSPTWSPGGEWVAYASGGSRDVYRRRADFSGEPEFLLAKNNSLFPMSWSLDGKWLAMMEDDSSGDGGNLWVLQLEGEGAGEAEPLLQSDSDERHPMISPNGQWMAYTSDESGQSEVYVQAFPDLGKRLQISTDGGRQPVWSRSGLELFYIHIHGQSMMAVEVAMEPEFRAGAPRVLFEGTFVQRFARDYDIAPDGESFVMIQADAGSRREQINVILNWFDELNRLVPTEN